MYVKRCHLNFDSPEITRFPLLLRLSPEHVCVDANVRNVKLIMPEAFIKRLRDILGGRQCSFTSFQRFKLGQTIVSNDPQSSLDRLHRTSDSYWRRSTFRLPWCSWETERPCPWPNCPVCRVSSFRLTQTLPRGEEGFLRGKRKEIEKEASAPSCSRHQTSYPTTQVGSVHNASCCDRWPSSRAISRITRN